MKGEVKNWLSVLAFVLVLAMALWLTAAIFNVKSVDQWPSSRIVTGFYEEPENTIDVLYLGTSHIMCACSPMKIWERAGITGYSLATERQYMGLSYYWLMEALKYQSPKVLVLDAMSLFAWPFSDMESRQRKALDYMKMSDVKKAAIAAVCQYDETADELSYYVPFLTYHARWDDLNRSDFTFIFQDKRYIPKGFCVCYTGIGEVENHDFFPSEGKHNMLAQSTLDYFTMIYDLCQSNDIQLLLTEMPRTTEWSREKNWTANNLAEEYGINFVDFNTPDMLEAIGFVPEEDMFDPWHCSSFGADKVSLWLADYLKENYEFDDHDQQVVDSWNSDMEIFSHIVEMDKKLRRELKEQAIAEAAAAEEAG